MSQSPRILTQYHPGTGNHAVEDRLILSAEERRRSRYLCHSEGGEALLLCLSRGLVLQEGDRLTTDAQDWWVSIQAKAEPLLVVMAASPLLLLQAAYHLGNRHVPVEVTATALKLSPDPVLKSMLTQLGVTVDEAIAPFHPEVGAYRTGHHDH